MKKSFPVQVICVISFLCVVGCSMHSVHDQYVKEWSEINDRHQGEIDACYKKVKAKNPKLGHGILKIEIEVGYRTKAYSIKQLEGFPGSEPLYECIAAKILTWEVVESYNSETRFWTSWKF